MASQRPRRSATRTARLCHSDNTPGAALTEAEVRIQGPRGRLLWNDLEASALSPASAVAPAELRQEGKLIVWRTGYQVTDEERLSRSATVMPPSLASAAPAVRSSCCGRPREVLGWSCRASSGRTTSQGRPPPWPTNWGCGTWHSKSTTPVVTSAAALTRPTRPSAVPYVHSCATAGRRAGQFAAAGTTNILRPGRPGTASPDCPLARRSGS